MSVDTKALFAVKLASCSNQQQAGKVHCEQLELPRLVSDTHALLSLLLSLLLLWLSLLLQLLFLVRRFDESNAFTCEEWSEVVPGNLPMWLMVKNYLLQYILLEATYLRSTCCILGKGFACGATMMMMMCS